MRTGLTFLASFLRILALFRIHAIGAVLWRDARAFLPGADLQEGANFPCSLEPNIPIQIKNTNRPEDTGTLSQTAG